MTTIYSGPVQSFPRNTTKRLLIAGGGSHLTVKSWNESRLFVRESWLARVALAIIVALAAWTALQMLGLFESFGGWAVLRNVSGWVGPSAVAGALGAAAAAAAAAAGAAARATGDPDYGSRGGEGEGYPLPDAPDPSHRHDKNPNGTYKYAPIKAGPMIRFSQAVDKVSEFLAGPKWVDQSIPGNAGGKS